MWLFTTFGCFSVVQKPGMQDLTVRTRVRADLDRLRERCLPELGETIAGAGTDYPYRAMVSHETFARALAQLGREINYANFKNEAVRTLGAKRGSVYAEVWNSVAKLETLEASPTSQPSGGTPETGRPKGIQRPRTTNARRPAHGGVVFDSRGRVLLFSPRGGFGGYAWTFPKGRPDRGEEPEQTAIREVREETGVEATIVAPIPGSFEGDTTDTTYYLMRFVRDTKHLGPEAEAIQWALPQEAAGLIAQTRSIRGRQRDMAVLKAALARSDKLPGGGR